MDTLGPHVKKKLDLCPQLGYKYLEIDLGRTPFMKTDLVKMRLSSAEKAAFQAAANLSGIPLSAWMRERLRRAAVRELEDASMPIAFLQNRA